MLDNARQLMCDLDLRFEKERCTDEFYIKKMNKIESVELTNA